MFCPSYTKLFIRPSAKLWLPRLTSFIKMGTCFTLPAHKLTVYCFVCFLAGALHIDAHQLPSCVASYQSHWYQGISCVLIGSHLSAHIVAVCTLFTCGRDRIYCRYKELLCVLCSLQHIVKGAEVCLQCQITNWISVPPEALHFCCPFSLMSTFLPHCCISPHQRPLAFTACCAACHSLFYQPHVALNGVPPVYDECHCLCPIQWV